MSLNQKDLWIGIGIGAAVGLTTGYFVGSSVSKKKAQKELKRVRKVAYLKGQSDAEMEARAVIDNLTDNVVFVDSTDNAEAIKEKIAEHFRKQEEEGQEESSSTDEEEPAQTDDVYAEKDEDQNRDPMPFTIAGDNVIFYGAAGTELRYPKYLIVDKANHLLDTIEIRENLKSFEPDIQKLRVIWNTMGWGFYIPELDGPHAWEQNLKIDDDDDLTLGDEPEEKTIERQRYLDQVERYIAHPEEAPQIISRQDFDDECYLEKLYFDYYDVDNKFIENTDMDSEVDGFTMFGFVNGNDLFEHKIPDEDDDPDIIHVRNFKMNCVMEVTRFHRAYSSIKDGSAYVNGGSN